MYPIWKFVRLYTRNSTKFLFWTLVFWLVSPLLSVSMTILYLYWFCVVLLAWLLHPDWIGMMSSYDKFSVGETTMRKNKNVEEGESGKVVSAMSVVLVLEGLADLDLIRRQFMERVLNQKDSRGKLVNEKFTWYFEDWFGFSFWKRDKEFSIENHIRFLSEGKEEMSQQEFVEKIGMLATRPFPSKRSPWEMLIVPIRNWDEKEGKMFAINWRFHHSILDGYSTMKLIIQNFGGEGETSLAKPPRTESRSILESIQFWTKYLACVGLEYFRIVMLDVDENEMHPPLKELAGEWTSVIMNKVDFSLVKRMSQSLGVSPTALVFGAIGGGISKFLKDKGKECPGHVRAFLTLPVPKHPVDGLVNHWTFGNLKVPLVGCWKERLMKTHRNYNVLKNSPVPEGLWTFFPFYFGVPNWLINIWGTNRATTMTFTNVIGPTKKLTFCQEWPIHDVMFWVARLRGNPSMYFGVLSYAGKMRMSLTVDKAVFNSRDQVEELARNVEQELLSFPR